MLDLVGLASAAQNRITLPDGGVVSGADIRSNPVNNVGVDGQSVEKTDFSAVLKEAVDHVNGLQGSAEQMRTDYVMGVSDDLVSTMIASEKASLAFQGVIQVRNRVVSAYETVFNMPV